MSHLWEYRVHTARLSGRDDDHDSQVLTNRADGWEIFAVEPTDKGTRLYMKRPKPAADVPA